MDVEYPQGRELWNYLNLNRRIDQLNSQNCDFLVIGSGASGLTAAISAARLGSKVTVIEKSNLFGGTTAYSGGGVWIPNNPHSDIEDSPEKAKTYLHGLLGNRYDESKIDAFIENAPKMVRFLESNTSQVRFYAADFMTDYEPGIPGASYGRSMGMPPFDAALLGPLFKTLRPPLPQMTALSGMQIGMDEIDYMLKSRSHIPSFLYAAKMISRHGIDLLRSGRGRNLKNGNSVAARLLHAAREAGCNLLNNTSAIELTESGGRVTGARVRIDGTDAEICASKGVLIATGGFAANSEMRKQFIPHAEHHHTLLPDENQGDGISMALKIGASMGETMRNNGVWTPVSIMKMEDGRQIKYPHISLDRARPGSIIVNQSGRRFENEATYYQRFVNTMQRTNSIPAWLIATKPFIRSYGMGLIQPYQRLAPYLKAGYLISAPTLVELAEKLGVDADGLTETVSQVARDAENGVDTVFARGANAYDQTYGDPTHAPNVNFAALGDGPFYAMELFPGDLGTTLAIVTDANAQVVGDGEPINGLYAAGLDMNSLWGGSYPGAGSSLGPGMTFGYVAAQHACGSPPSV